MLILCLRLIDKKFYKHHIWDVTHIRNWETDENREARHEEVAGRVHVDVLQVREPHGEHDPEQRQVHAADNRLRHTDEKGGKFAEYSTNHHYNCTCLDNTPAPDLFR